MWNFNVAKKGFSREDIMLILNLILDFSNANMSLETSKKVLQKNSQYKIIKDI